ncbi:hypothetical protein QE152_g24644 [Popillia japonica]|uniref:Uncharacterized protein n=1 Tax=Popillia japonica TaxID=7064 RepID=A0AAW1K337_POPJA
MASATDTMETPKRKRMQQDPNSMFEETMETPKRKRMQQDPNSMFEESLSMLRAINSTLDRGKRSERLCKKYW